VAISALSRLARRRRRPISRITRGVAVAIAAGAASALLAAAAPQTTRDARQRHLYVNVITADGTPVKDLKVADFIVREDDRAREVLEVGPAPPASHIAILIDDSASTSAAIPHVRPAVLDFVRYLLGMPNPPQVGLATVGERPTRRAEFTTSLPAVEAAIAKIFPVTGSGSYLLEAIIEVTNDFRRRKAERPVIVAFVEDSGPEFSSVTRQEVTTALKSTRASLWAIVVQKGSPNLSSREYQERAQVLNDVATQSGGANRTVISDLGIQSSFKWVTTLLTTQTRVTYSRPETLIPPTNVSVEVRRPNLRVIATRWAGQ
jgi:hypothetical protein